MWFKALGGVSQIVTHTVQLQDLGMGLLLLLKELT